ncbi:MAG: thiamine diphosphokinase [Acidobacteria bacterium]|jgi:thiamine pyrophosphokinase|nr:thiamine diphosphokinase [Acidobacteriota bacterium]
MTLFEGSLLVANAPLKWHPRLARMASTASPLLAADGGANHLARIGLRPEKVIGDLDSISTSARAWLGEPSMLHLPDQSRTDLDKAVAYAFDEMGVERLTVLAALGGRTDHDASNLGLLARLAMGERLVFEDVGQRVLALIGEAALLAAPGEAWSFWTFDPAVRVSIDGVRWQVRDADLSAGTTPSISNEATGEEIRIQATGGAVVVARHYR